mmetsp:Transcript_4667/g.16989  ORF Transcript_4667/g.16989 Transcript_4667/m.16989 type:complete len:274 (-) Transcript_4667:58-879(-)
MIRGKCFRNWFSESFLSWTKEFLAANNIVLVLCDDLKHEVYLNSNVCAEEREILPIPLLVSAPSKGVYIRLHRRQGTQRVISQQEIADWVVRLQTITSENSLQGGIFFLWGTDHEDQPMQNAKNLMAAAKDLHFDWKKCVDEENTKKGGLLSFLKAPAKRKQEDTQEVGSRKKIKEEETLEEEEKPAGHRKPEVEDPAAPSPREDLKVKSLDEEGGRSPRREGEQKQAEEKKESSPSKKLCASEVRARELQSSAKKPVLHKDKEGILRFFVRK